MSKLLKTYVLNYITKSICFSVVLIWINHRRSFGLLNDENYSFLMWNLCACDASRMALLKFCWCVLRTFDWYSSVPTSAVLKYIILLSICGEEATIRFGCNLRRRSLLGGTKRTIPLLQNYIHSLVETHWRWWSKSTKSTIHCFTNRLALQRRIVNHAGFWVFTISHMLYGIRLNFIICLK